MILAVDIGNSAVKLGLVDARRVVRRRVVASAAAAGMLARAVASVVPAGRVEAVVISSVRPRATARLVRATARATGLRPTVVSYRTPMPIALAVRHPARVGVDRLCAACGALSPRRRGAIVITVGSAITVNLVVDRVFRGGVIMPGPAVALAALHRFTAQLPRLQWVPAPAGIRDTAAAMRWGGTLAAVGGIRQAVAMLDARAGRRLPRFVTGGYSGRLRPWLPAGWTWDPDLTLLGLARIAIYASLQK